MQDPAHKAPAGTHIILGVLISFLVQLPTYLIPVSHAPTLVASVRIKDEEARLKNVGAALSALPWAHLP